MPAGTSFQFSPRGGGQNFERLPRGGVQNMKKTKFCVQKHKQITFFQNQGSPSLPPPKLCPWRTGIARRVG